MASQAHRRFTVADYERMVTAGILTEDDRIELVGGEIFEMSPIGGRHVQCVNRLTGFLSRNAGPGMVVSVQNPVRLPPDGEPQPDLAIIHDRDYSGLLPTVADVLLVIEVADSSREYDRGMKFPLYAAAGITEAWLVDIVAATVERYTEPRAGSYRVVTYAHTGESLPSTVIPSLSIPVDTILS